MKLDRKRDFKKAGIYKITNKTTNKFYIGKSINIYERIRSHINLANKKSKNENSYFTNAWHKYGRDDFYYEVLEYCEPDDSLLKDLELKWIYETNALTVGYNLRLDTDTKCILSEETKLKMSQSKIKMYSNPNYDKSKHSHKFWQNNPDKKLEMAQLVSKNKKKYRIEQYNIDGNLIKVWDSVNEIIETNPNYKWQNIYSVCNGYKSKIYGFIWRKIT